MAAGKNLTDSNLPRKNIATGQTQKKNKTKADPLFPESDAGGILLCRLIQCIHTKMHIVSHPTLEV